MRRGRGRPACLAVLMAAGVLACGTLSIPEERSLGEQVNEQVRRDVKRVRDERVVAYVRDLGRRIVRASGNQPFPYRFYVVDAEQINAFALPAGYVYVNTGTILQSRNVSELAGVIGHEVGHVANRHVAQNYNRSRGVGIAHQLGVLTAALVGGGAAAQAASLGGGLAGSAYLNSYGRDAEREADQFAVEVLPRAGYDPDGLVTFFETLRRETGGSAGPSWLSSHPATDERIAATRAAIRAESLPRGLVVRDGGKLEIIQKRIRLLSGER